MPKHRHQEWIRFLNQIKRSVPKDKQIHIICDNYATHKHQKVQLVEAQHALSCALHTDQCIGLNMVERFFRDLSNNGFGAGFSIRFLS